LTLREEMLDAARAGAARLGDDRAAVASFLRSRVGPRGGFAGRSGEEDIYYTLFGVEGLVALGERPPARTADYLRSFGAGAGLDLVHLSSLVRCRASSPDICGPDVTCRASSPDICDPGMTCQAATGALDGAHPSLQSQWRGAQREGPAESLGWLREAERNLAAFRTADGGFAQSAGAPRATAHGCFLAFGAYEDLGIAQPHAERFAEVLERFRAADGGYANEAGRDSGATPITGGILLLRRRLALPADDRAKAWLMERRHPEGGFLATAGAPVPDLLSTAGALLALSDDPEALEAVRRPCLRFLDVVWDEGTHGFRGNALDDVVDCEYTWYGLLALGILSRR
jgi:hypothetical protein